jgi:Serine/threonine protein kinase
MVEIIASTYECIEKIGSGGGGNVYLANHLRLGKKVVLKADKRKITTRSELLRREVDILKDLSHSYIPQVYDFFVEEEIVYTVMDFVEGESLDKPLKRGERYFQSQVVKWAQQLLEALCYLHSPTHGTLPRGFVHSDIKPANIMCTPQNDIILIDFNIALALGEENVVGRSTGYASPEHYGLDFSSGNETETLDDDTATVTMPNLYTNSSSKRIVHPDVRSDIYSVGATLYHLLTGRRPAKHAMEVEKLSEKEFSSQIVKIISKAMNPNPDLRYQTAAEMLDAFVNLRKNDPRVRRRRRKHAIICVLSVLFFALGAFTSFVGLKRMQMSENALKLAEYSQNARLSGDSTLAIDYALQALPEKRGIFIPPHAAEARKALTDALKIYDLSDGYKTHKVFELPSAPLYMQIAPDGKTAACVYSHAIAVFDTDSAEILVTLEAEESALAEVKYLNNSTIAYAGKNGVAVYDILKDSELWKGKPATAVSISADGTVIAAVYKDEKFATVYDSLSGDIKYELSFEDKYQRITVNDNFANPKDNLLALNHDGTLLAVSFADGSLYVYNLFDSEGDIELFDNTSGYTHFEGGFYKQYFAFSATNKSESVFAVVDTLDMKQTGGFDSENPFGVQADETGIYVQTDNLLVNIHPVTGDQIPLVTISQNILRFDFSDIHTLMTSENEFMFFDKNANLISSHKKEHSSDFLQIREGMALLGGRDSPVIRIMKFESHPTAEIFSYDPFYEHDEARISSDGKTIMLFSYKHFRLYSAEGKILAEVDIPNASQVYDQQYRRDEKGSYLEVIYNDGKVNGYSAVDSILLYERDGEKPDLTLYEEFNTDTLRIESPLHGTPTAYDKNTGELVRELEKEAYLTYVTQVGEYIITQYITTDNYFYGLLLNSECEVLAELPYLSDIIEGRLIFDYPTGGNLKESRIFTLNELIELGYQQTK